MSQIKLHGTPVAIGGQLARLVDLSQSTLFINGFGWDPRNLLGTIITLDRRLDLSAVQSDHGLFYELRCGIPALDGQLVYAMGSQQSNNRFAFKQAIDRL